MVEVVHAVGAGVFAAGVGPAGVGLADTGQIVT